MAKRQREIIGIPLALEVGENLYELRHAVGSYAPTGDERMANKRASYRIRFIKQGDENELLQKLVENKVYEVLLNTQFSLSTTETNLFRHYLVVREKGDEQNEQ